MLSSDFAARYNSRYGKLSSPTDRKNAHNDVQDITDCGLIDLSMPDGFSKHISRSLEQHASKAQFRTGAKTIVHIIDM